MENMDKTISALEAWLKQPVLTPPPINDLYDAVAILKKAKKQQQFIGEIIDIKRDIVGKGMHELTEFEQGQIDGLRIALEILIEQT